MKGAEIVIVGGGVVGASAAYHLAKRGCRDIVLLDRSAGPGGGSTALATGGYRAQYATAVNVRLSLLSRDKLRCFRDEIGVDSGYTPAGYLWLAGTEAELAILRQGIPIQHAAGLTEATEVGLDDVSRINPALALGHIAGGTWCPTDGFIDPRAMLDGYLAAAGRLGVRIEWGVDVAAISCGKDRRVASLETSRGRIPAGAVVNAAGAWAAQLAGLAGVDLPVVPLRRQVVPTGPCDLLPATMPMTIFAGDGFHLRVRGDRVLLLWPTPGADDRPYDTVVDPAWIDAVVEKACTRVPVLSRATIDRGGAWGGLYEVSPDKHAILGAAPQCENLFLINGSSGHGVMHAPALGHLLAEIMTDGAATTIDATPLRPTRFAEGKPNPVSELL